MGYVCLFSISLDDRVDSQFMKLFGWSVSINDKWPIASVYAHKRKLFSNLLDFLLLNDRNII